MAIDTSMYAAKIPAATYAVGDKIPMKIIRGPAVVRDGYGRAILKRIVTVANTSQTAWKINVKNSNWVDELSNPALVQSETTFANESGAVQSGQDCDLMPNSGWDVVAECIYAGTEASDLDIACLIDIDYPKIAAVLNPKNVQGFPVTIDGVFSHTITGTGLLADSPKWTTYNVDVFKAGSKYLLTEAFFRDDSTFGFMSISGAAGQAGLERIIPVRSKSVSGLRYSLDYSTPLVKGPMNINLLSVGTAGTANAYVYMDYVKKPVA